MSGSNNPNRNLSNNNATGGGTMSTLGNARGRIGIVGIIIVVLLALWFGVSPMQALNLFGGSQTTTTTQTTANPNQPDTTTQAPR
ncbi:hypothetical protein AA101099_2710 [Neoasaia chiangmaiensis NBRC 101099]|uniref:Uncharacterized protein n=1 Tax=Neoasaia chiangmaiensis TaxID=320497 RepID=A0A1U9KPB2_9PROT|nr:neutral zinc metallopeptidase [Neoasaia chiangmaiensis]AQS87642.1 hypothetical protein A0U93_06500 [Neoasaia chiangmaiensis]GBR42012.1 hypothetical protein AA101099_2710 [Neoasaia chiangmaiensis NBRC 101099]GEN14213.1 hypothetical protein NCH01_06440 [Neoasaia chiangmaiensis]